MSKTTHTTETFRAAAAARMAEWAQVGAITNAGLTTDLGYLGMSAEIKASETPVVKLEIKTDPNEGLPAGTKRDQFTAEALAEYDAATLRRAQERLWNLVRSRQQAGIISSDEAESTLRTLGFGDASMPKLESDVVLYTHDEDGDMVRYSFRVAGKPSKDEVRERFTAIAPPHPHNVAIQSVYPDANPDSLVPAVSDVHVSTSVNWPSKCEFSA